MTRVLIDSGLHTLIPHADDLVEWLFAILERGVSGRPYNVGSPEAISNRDLAVLVRDTLHAESAVRVRGTLISIFS